MADQGRIPKDAQFRRFCAYGFLKNLRFFEPFLLLFLLENHISLFQAGILYGVQALSVNLLEIPSGFLADAWGRRRVLAAGFGIYALSFMLFAFGDSFSWYVAAFILFGAADALRTGVHKAMILQHLESEGLSGLKVRYYGATRSWSQRGSAVSALLAAAIVMMHGELRSIFLYSMLPALADMMLVLSYPSRLDGYLRKDPISPMVKLRLVFLEFVVTFRDWPALKATLNAALLNGFHQASKDYLQPMLQAAALSLPVAIGLGAGDRQALVIGIVYSLVFFASSIASRNAYRLRGEGRSLMNILLLLAFVVSLGAGLLYSDGRLWIPVALFILIRVIVNLRRPVSVSVLSEVYRQRSMASGMSAESQLQTLMSVIMAPLLGWIADRWGLGTGLWVLSGFLLLILPLLWVRKARPLSSASH